MCGIVGLFLKDKTLEPQLGQLLSDMLVTMTDRGPDSAGIAIYGSAADGRAKVTIQSADPAADFSGLAETLKESGVDAVVTVKSTHAVLDIPAEKLDGIRPVLSAIRPNVRVMGSGDSVEIYKETGLPKDVVTRFDVRSMAGTHGIGHTRMATESAVTTLGAHPFSTGADQCLVHNGSLSNHNNLRRELIRSGMTFETENDTEVAAAYLTAENAYTDAVMKPLAPLQETLYKEMLGRIKETDLSVPSRKDGYYYYSRTEQGKQYPIYCRKKGSLDAAEEIYLDVNELAKGEKYMGVGAMSVIARPRPRRRGVERRKRAAPEPLTGRSRCSGVRRGRGRSTATRAGSGRRRRPGTNRAVCERQRNA